MKIACLRYGALFIFLLLSGLGWAQTKRITGKVISEEDGHPLAGVSIQLKGQPGGLQTGADGSFVLEAAAGQVVVLSYTGYLPAEVTIESQSHLAVALKADAAKLGEVVVIGYGKQSRRTLSGSVSTIDARALKSVPNTNVATALQGNVSGLRVQQTSGEPGASPAVTFRGGTSFDGTGAPLYIVDGVIVPTLYGISIDDVETIDLLKDAASTSIYGARAANGVVLVTTKRGKRGRTQVTYRMKLTRNLVRRNPVDFLDAEDYIRWNRYGLANRLQANLADNNTGQANNTRNQLTAGWGWAVNTAWRSPDGLYSTQLLNSGNRHLLGDPAWRSMADRNPLNPSQVDTLLFRSISQRSLEDLILQESTMQEHHLGVSGANDMGSFALGIGALKDVGMVIGSQLNRLNLNFNGGLNLNKDLKVNLTVGAYSVKSSPSYTAASSSSNLGGLIQRFGGIAPTVRLTHDLTGEILPGVSGVSLGNPLYLKDKFINNTSEQRFSGALNLEYSLSSHLKLLASGSGFMRYTTSNEFTKEYQNGTGGAMISTRNTAFSHNRTNQYTFNSFLQYDRTFGGHQLSVLGGGEYYNYEVYTSSASASGGSTDYVPWMSGSTLATGVPSSAFSQWDRLASAIGRVNYNYDTRYLLTVNLRYDGSSRLYGDYFELFPGISAGWNLHNESFFRNSRLSQFVTTIKPRFSWGQNGNIGSLGYFTTDPTYNDVGIYNGTAGFGPNSIVNMGMKWEKVSALNFGVDLGLARNRVTLIADYFVRDVFDKIAQMPIPSWTGFSNYSTNLGQLQNRGVEVEARVNIIRPAKKDGFALDVSANFSHVKSYAIHLPDNGLARNRQSTLQVWDPRSGAIVHVGGLQEGKRIGLDEVWAYAFDGLYTSQAELDKAAGLYNANLPYTNKRLKFLGDARWRDIDGNDTINLYDRVYVGRTTPTAMGGFSTFVSWKGFSLYAQMDYALGFVIMNQSWLRGMSQVQGSQNGPTDIKETWTPENPNAKLPAYSWANYTQNYIAFANYWQKGDYLALREVTLSYEMPFSLLKGIFRERISGLRAYVTGSNLAYFTQYNGTLPEEGGDDPGRFPLPRRITLGINLTL